MAIANANANAAMRCTKCKTCFGACGPKARCTGAREGGTGARHSREMNLSSSSKHLLHPLLTTLSTFEASDPRSRQSGSQALKVFSSFPEVLFFWGAGRGRQKLGAKQAREEVQHKELWVPNRNSLCQAFSCILKGKAPNIENLWDQSENSRRLWLFPGSVRGFFEGNSGKVPGKLLEKNS